MYSNKHRCAKKQSSTHKHMENNKRTTTMKWEEQKKAGSKNGETR